MCCIGRFPNLLPSVHNHKKMLEALLVTWQPVLDYSKEFGLEPLAVMAMVEVRANEPMKESLFNQVN